MGDIVNIEEKKNESYKLTEQDKQDILDTMQKEVERNENLKVLSQLPSNNGIEENKENLKGETKEVDVIIDGLTGEKTILGSSTKEKVENAEEDFFSSLDNTNFDTHYNILASDIKKVASEETSFGTFDISDETTIELLKVINKYKEDKKISYKDLPVQVREFIDDYMKKNGMYAASNVIAYNSIRNDMANMLIDEYINQIELNKWSDDFNIQMEKFSEEMKTEMSPLYKELNDNREEYLQNLIDKLSDDEKKEKAEAILNSIKDAFALTRLKEAAPKIKIKNFDLEKPGREYKDLMNKYIDNQYHIYDLFMITNVLNRHLLNLKLIEKNDRTTAIKFVVAFCKFCKNYKTTVPEEHAFMYFVTYNIILLDVYKGDTYDTYSFEFLNNILEVVHRLK